MVIARLLTPQELGVFAVAAAGSTLLAAFKNFGTSNYLIQCKAVDPPAVGSAFIATFFISAVLGFGLFTVSHEFAMFFNEPGIEPILKLLAANFLITPFITVGTSLLIRFQRFRQLIFIEISSAFVAMVVSVSAAYLGLGSLALALGMTAHSLAMLALIHNSATPSLTYVPSYRDIGKVLSFGGWSSGAILLNQLGARSNEFVIGKVLGVSFAAMFDKAASLSTLVGEQLFGDVLRVLLPVFADHRRKNREAELKRKYLEYMGILGTILVPLYLFLSFNAFPLITILYGDQWLAAVPVASLIALEYMIISPCLVGEKLLISDGKVKKLFFIKAVQFAMRVMALLAFVSFGLLAASGGLVAAAVVYAWVIQGTLKRLLDLNWSDLTASQREPLLAGIGGVMSGVITLWLFGYAEYGAEFQQIGASALINLAIWLALGKLFNFSAYSIVLERFRDSLKKVWK